MSKFLWTLLFLIGLYSFSLFQASRILQKLTEPAAVPEASIPSTEITSSVLDETPKTELSNLVLLVDYSNLFGEDFQIPDDHWDLSYLNILDIGAVEEGILHVLFACAAQVSYNVRGAVHLKHTVFFF